MAQLLSKLITLVSDAVSPLALARPLTADSSFSPTTSKAQDLHMSPVVVRSASSSDHGSSSLSSEGSSQQASHSHDDNYDYEEGAYNVVKGALIRKDRFKVRRIAGKGTFGVVVEAHDAKYNEMVALKIVRSVERYLRSAETEIHILQKLTKQDTDGTSLTLQFLGSFEFTQKANPHVCIVTERCGQSLYQFMKMNHFAGFKLEQVAIIGYQVFHSIGFCHQQTLIHTDLKPENVLLYNSSSTKQVLSTDAQTGKTRHYRIPESLQIRVIDFGGATYENEHHTRIINTRQYRSPEVQLGLSWSYPSDVWSLGCILVELYTGELLFDTHDESEHLAMLEKTLGRKIPSRMIADSLAKEEWELKNSSRRRRHQQDAAVSTLLSKETLTISYPAGANRNSLKRLERQKPLEKTLKGHPDFIDLIRQCLHFEPSLRITVEDALRHPFFKQARGPVDQIFQELRRKKAARALAWKLAQEKKTSEQQRQHNNSSGSSHGSSHKRRASGRNGNNHNSSSSSTTTGQYSSEYGHTHKKHKR